MTTSFKYSIIYFKNLHRKSKVVYNFSLAELTASCNLKPHAHVTVSIVTAHAQECVL